MHYQVDICDAAQDEKDLDWGVVPRDEVEEEIDVSWKEDQEIQDLRFSRNSFARLGGNDFDKYCEDGSIVGYVAHHTKQIHPHNLLSSVFRLLQAIVQPGPNHLYDNIASFQLIVVVSEKGGK